MSNLRAFSIRGHSFVLHRLSLITLGSIFLMLSLVSPHVMAEKEVDLFTSKVLVLNQTEELRKTAISSELAKVFVRLSGDKTVLQNPQVARAVRNAMNYLQEFSYQSTEQVIVIAGSEFPASELALKFSPEPLEKILTDEQLPLWPANRPEVLFWIASEQETKVDYLDEALAANLKQAAVNYGVPDVKPILDLEDRLNLPAINLWAMDEARILDAANRYAVEAIVAGRISPNETGFEGSFLLIHGDARQYFSLQASTSLDLADALLDQVSQYFSGLYAFVAGSSFVEEQVQIVVNHRNDFAVYADVIEYLGQLTGLERSQLVEVNQSNLIFDVAYLDSLQKLLNTIALDKKMEFFEERRLVKTAPAPQSETSEAAEPMPPQAFDQTASDEVIEPGVENTSIKNTTITQLIFYWLG